MNPTRHAVALGLRRGWTEFVLSLRSAQDQGFYLFMAVATLGYLWINRDTEVEGTDLLYPTVALPSLLGALLAFGVIIGPAYALAMEREDGTLLRHKAVPHGMRGYVTGQLLYHSLGLVPLLLVILVPSFLLFDDVMSNGLAGWATLAWVVVLGLLATLPIGMVIGSLVPSVQKVGTWGMLPVLDPHRDLRHLRADPGAVGLGAGRRAGVPDLLDRAGHAVGVPARRGRRRRDRRLLAHRHDGPRPRSPGRSSALLVTPRVLRRMARRQSGSQVQEAREAAAQWVR